MYSKLILLFIFFGLLILLSSFRKDKRKKMIFFGDSITAAGTGRTGYITVLKNMLQKEGIDNYKLVNAGVSGNKAHDLYLRVEEDVIHQSPDIVVLFIGVNDVWHKKTHGTDTDADQFEKLYRSTIRKLQAANAKVVLCTPAVIGEKNNNNNEQDEDLNEYAAIIKNIGNDLQLPVCDLRMLFQNYIREYNTDDANSGILTTDGVHLNDAGNRLVAEAIWEKMKVVLL
ncbi:G-D-S-L family lipolytic protein [Ilyomonas limi]|uniref:G-D-S-L family lipolytic protein n=1 Tax=Ilyomonas limi TaxID=2575867 RepID=A0A4U3KQJ0_9BACT|nr:SGNH/GDSL hydrolase family protein [Ilyomonas limi]TKK64421.1 G-D-S-L family lipolytic protein [Ilyomonas limi]